MALIFFKLGWLNNSLTRWCFLIKKKTTQIYDLNLDCLYSKHNKEILSLGGYSEIDYWTFFLTVKKSIKCFLLRNLSEILKFGFSRPDLIEIRQLIVSA